MHTRLMENRPEAAPVSRTAGPAPFSDRRAFLRSASSPSRTIDKHEFVLGACRRRAVLDVGCVDHDAENAFRGGARWLHREIADVAGSVIGLDMLDDDVARLVEAGYDVVAGNAESFDLGRTFDVVVAADLIEHLGDPASFLRSARKHMGPDS